MRHLYGLLEMLMFTLKEVFVAITHFLYLAESSFSLSIKMWNIVVLFIDVVAKKFMEMLSLRAKVKFQNR